MTIAPESKTRVCRSSVPLVVGIGASAGGLAALRQLFAHVPADSGIGFVVIQHLDPDRPSMLPRVLEGATPLPVVEATSGMLVEPNRVHVIPSGSDLSIHHGSLALARRQRTGRLYLPIDSFFRSLAEDHEDRAIGVVLSGSGADGAEGLRAIKAAGGITIAQEPSSAEFRSMPDSAIATGIVDFCGDPEEIAREIARLSRHPSVAAPDPCETEAQRSGPDDDRGFAAILALVRRQAGLDLRVYKRTTVQRRIERRMALQHANSMDEYAQALRSDAAEVRALARDMLIQVTSFFRDREAFKALEESVFRELVRRKADDDPIRIWIPGCSTGEEAYSVAMCLLEAQDGQAKNLSIKVFGSDISGEAIETARLGRYSEAALANVSPERSSRFFERIENGYQITRQLRDLVVFVRHDITRDPPFARLDLISCRNVLIYFDAEMQRRVIPMLHYCLSSSGYLFLGKSETITDFPDLFAAVDKEQRIFVKTGESTPLAYPLPLGRETEARMSATLPAERRQPAREAQNQADHLLLRRYAPPGAIVNDRMEILQFRGRTGAYFESPPGEPQSNVLRMTREGLVVHLHEAIDRARAQSCTVRKEGLRIRDGAETRLVNLEVIPLTAPPDSADRYYLILFEEPALAAQRARLPALPEEPLPPAEQAAREVEQLKVELAATKDYLQSLVADHHGSTDDLAAANEELVAANEELQSTNEELQSAKEELQATNEELGTVNDQLRNRNEELDEVASDLANVLASVEIPVIIVDLELRVRRFTPTVNQVARFVPEDVGRPIDDLRFKMQVDDIPARIQTVIEGLVPKEWEVQDLDGRWFRLQIRPYRTTHNRLDGAVISFVDVDALKHALMDAESARDYARSVVDTVPSSLVVLDPELRVVSANEAFLHMFAQSEKSVEQRCLSDLGVELFDQPAVQRALRDALDKHDRIAGLELTTDIPHRGRRIVSLTGRPILWSAGEPLVLLAIDDVTNLRALEAERSQLLASEKQARVEAERASRAKDLFLALLSHELRTPLSTMLMSTEILKRGAGQDPRLERASAAMERAVNAQARLIDDLLDVSRIVSGKLLLDLGPVSLVAVVQEAVDIARPAAEAKAIELTLSIDGEIGLAYGDAGRLQQVASNLLTNAIKFTPHAGRVSVRLEQIDGRARLTVTDTGIGIRPEVLPQLFNRFVQADSAMTRTHGGLGLGLSIVRHLVEIHEGEVSAESAGEGMGSTFRVTLPVGLATPSETSNEPKTTTTDIKGVRVLLVEDDDDTRESYAAMLTEFGADVRAVPSAAAGLAALEEHRPQVILSDIAMPGEDGVSFIRKVRRLGHQRSEWVPAAALTALAGDEDKLRALRSGFQMHVVKPVTASQLVSIVGRLMRWGIEGPDDAQASR